MFGSKAHGRGQGGQQHHIWYNFLEETLFSSASGGADGVSD